MNILLLYVASDLRIPVFKCPPMQYVFTNSVNIGLWIYNHSTHWKSFATAPSWHFTLFKFWINCLYFPAYFGKKFRLRISGDTLCIQFFLKWVLHQKFLSNTVFYMTQWSVFTVIYMIKLPLLKNIIEKRY